MTAPHPASLDREKDKLYVTGLLTIAQTCEALQYRVGHGVCPCCNRTFGDLYRHMSTKHPGYAAEAAE